MLAHQYAPHKINACTERRRTTFVEMNRKDEHAAGSDERDARLDALDRHAEERDRLFIAALIDQDRERARVAAKLTRVNANPSSWSSRRC